MKLISINPVAQQRLAVAVPIVAVVLSLFVVRPACGRYGDLKQDNEKKSGEIRRMVETPIPRPGPVRPADDSTSTEPPQFMGMIRLTAQKSSCLIATFDSNGAGETKQEGPVRNIRAKLDLIGTYPQIRSFLWNLSHSHRLYVVTDLSISTNTPIPAQALSRGAVRASFNIERYVTTPAKPKAEG